jgi:hypothetical protein
MAPAYWQLAQTQTSSPQTVSVIRLDSELNRASSNSLLTFHDYASELRGISSD